MAIFRQTTWNCKLGTVNWVGGQEKAKKFVNVVCEQILSWNSQNWVFRPFLWTSLSIVQKPWVELMVEFWEFSLQVQFVSGCDLLPFFVNFECYINNMNANKISPLYLIIKWDSILYAEFRIALCFYPPIYLYLDFLRSLFHEIDFWTYFFCQFKTCFLMPV